MCAVRPRLDRLFKIVSAWEQRPQNNGDHGNAELKRHMAPVFTTQILVTYDAGCEQQQREKTYSLDDLSKDDDCTLADEPDDGSALMVRTATHTMSCAPARRHTWTWSCVIYACGQTVITMMPITSPNLICAQIRVAG